MTVNIDKKQIQVFQKKILDWYKVHRRNLPWRDVPVTAVGRSGASFRDPYEILVSEVMLQQTQVGRVIPKYKEWLEAFPTIQSLAKANTREVLLHWSGLGYNRRALYLKRVAEILVKQSKEMSFPRKRESIKINGSPIRSGMTRKVSSRLRSNNKILRFTQNDSIIWPRTEKELRKLPGIGEYTARAILCFAFNKQVAVVDTNVRRVILTQFMNVIPGLTRNLDSRLRGNNDKRLIQEIADQLLPKGKAYEWNQALMDYAAAELKAHKIPIPRQSRFKDSDRYYRGQIVKYLLKNKKNSIESLYESFSSVHTMNSDRFKRIIGTMQKDRLIKVQKNKITFV